MDQANGNHAIFNKEKDYVFLKTINVIYIDQDMYAQKVMTKYIGDSIHLVACDSLYEAFDIIESKNYDLILCDMLTSTDVSKKFFTKYSHKIPIIALSSTMDPKFAYTAAKMGAKDYITKNEDGLKSISRSLHKVYYDWTKDTEQKNAIQLLNDPKVRIVLKDLINTELSITQRVSTTFVNDLQINDTIRNTYNIQANDILAENPYILKSLIRMEFVKKEFVGQTLGCPNCKSVNIFANYFCDNCKNSNFISKKIPVHNNCGQIIFNDKIHRHGQIKCPHCKVYFENSPSEYSDVNGYQCNTCNVHFIRPSISYSCNNCNFERFSIIDGRWIALYRYNLQLENLNKIKNNIFLLKNLEQYLKGVGFEIKQYEKFAHKDQSFGPFELVAIKDTQIFLFIILGNDLQENLSRLFEIDFASKDKEIKSFAIAFIEPQEIVLKLLEKFGILLLVKEETTEIFDGIKNHIHG